MKVYIVTTGSYSDYGIYAVFVDKEKALKCIDLLYNANDLEEYNTSDDLEQKRIAKFYIDVFEKEDYLNCNVRYCKTDPFDDYKYEEKTQYIIVPWEHNVAHLKMERYIYDENMTPEKVKFYENKFRKAGYDMWYIVQQKLSEGCSVEQINEIIKS